ncbi:hypothetical protein BKA61DRAFT_51695 [Leptodontidium sp. MPI-SDFR-AT-0119]|nr:hypothetical protein BKA61DRAFT_51695 [Leptodontidium sp. MPI-SDFR-AT-0119]
MATHHGWDREAMLQRGGVESEASEHISAPSLPAFTPVNPSRALPQFVSPQLTLHERGLDDDALYQQPLETMPEITVQEGKKRGAAQANKGRVVSIARVWEYRDEGDVAAQNQGANFETSFPKRRKSAPAKRTKSVSGQSGLVEPKQEQHTPSPASLHDKEHLKEEQDPQLTFPPNSGKRLPKKAPPKRNIMFKPSPFRNPVITKPSASREKHLEEVTIPTKPVTTYQGWTSTQEAVKHQFNGLSKTTLDKLAAFRHKPSSQAQRVVHSPASESIHVEKYPGPAEKTEGPPTSSDDGFLPRDDSIFVDTDGVDQDPAGCQAEQSQPARDSDHLHEGNPFFDDATWDVNLGSGVDDDARSLHSRVPAPDTMSLSVITSQNNPNPLSLPGAPAPSPAPLPLASQAFHADLRGSQHTSDYGDPSSSETRELAAMMNDVAQRSHCDEKGLIEEPRQPEYFFPDDCQTTIEDIIEQGQLESLQPSHGDLPSASHETGGDDPYGVSRDYQVASTNLHAEIPYSRHLADIEVERSDIDEPQMTPRDISNDFELDDFDNEGVDDADLLAIASDAAIPETQPLLLRTVKGNSVNDWSTAFPPVRTHGTQPMVTGAGDAHLVRSRPTTPEMFSDDEYPLEDGLEEEDMISLPAHLQGVIETFQPPPSLEYSFGNGPMPGEVYDKSLQFSPSKSRPASVLPRNATGMPLTDGQSPLKSQHVIDLGSVPAEEEDWSSFRSNNSMKNAEIPIVPDSISDQEHNNPDKTAKSAIPLGPQRQRKRSTYPKIPAATQSPTSQEIVLDDSHDYEPLQPFARPDFPSLVLDRCPILGVTADSFLRVCFRVGELFREGARCNALKQDAVIELFARITFSSREPGTTKQHFQFADLWHDRPPFPNGILANYKTSGLAESESRAFIGAEEHMMARCIGRLKKDTKNANGWFIEIINIRPTDWEEVKWTKRIVSAGLVKSEKGGV